MVLHNFVAVPFRIVHQRWEERFSFFVHGSFLPEQFALSCLAASLLRKRTLQASLSFSSFPQLNFQNSTNFANVRRGFTIVLDWYCPPPRAFFLLSSRESRATSFKCKTIPEENFRTWWDLLMWYMGYYIIHEKSQNEKEH